jgi:hypothetical protein
VALISLIMRLELLCPFDHPLIDRVAEDPIHTHDAGFLHLVAQHHAFTTFPNRHTQLLLVSSTSGAFAKNRLATRQVAPGLSDSRRVFCHPHRKLEPQIKDFLRELSHTLPNLLF